MTNLWVDWTARAVPASAITLWSGLPMTVFSSPRVLPARPLTGTPELRRPEGNVAPKRSGHHLAPPQAGKADKAQVTAGTVIPVTPTRFAVSARPASSA